MAARTAGVPGPVRDSRRGRNPAADCEWFLGSEQNRPMCELVEETAGDNMRNHHHPIHLEGLAGRKCHTGVVTNTRYEILLVGTWLDRTVRVAEVDGSGAVERDRGCLCLKKLFHQTLILRTPTEREHALEPAGTVHSPPRST